MPENIDNRSYLYADDTKIFRNGFDLSSIQTDLSNVIFWAAENRIEFNFDEFEQTRKQKPKQTIPFQRSFTF